MPEEIRSKKRYVPLTEASKLSGYTSDYIERLCRLGKIPCRLMGDRKIVALDALLMETGTILLEGEHVGFIEIEDENQYPMISSFGEVPASSSKTEKKEIGESIPRRGPIMVVGKMVEAGEENKENKWPDDQPPPEGGLPVDHSETPPTRPSTDTTPHQKIHVPIEKDIWEHSLFSGEAEYSHGPSLNPPPQQELTHSSVPESQSSPTFSSSPVETVRARPLPVPYHPHLPALFQPNMIGGKFMIAGFAAWLFAAPSVLGIGNMLLALGEKVEHTLGNGVLALQEFAHRVPISEGNQMEEANDPLLSTVIEGTHGRKTGKQKTIAITPSERVPSSDDFPQTLEGTFSDPVEIIPDADGKGGVIRPVFREGTGPSYIYVVVPER